MILKDAGWDAVDSQGGGRSDSTAADSLRAESYALMSEVCGLTGKNKPKHEPLACVTPDGKFVLEVPFLGRISMDKDGSSVLSHADGSSTQTDKDGHVTKVVYPNGVTREFAYDSGGSVNWLKDGSGRQWLRVLDTFAGQVWVSQDGSNGTMQKKFGEVSVDGTGELTATFDGVTEIRRTNGNVARGAGDRFLEFNDKGQRVKETWAHGYSEYQYGKEGFLDTVEKRNSTRTVKEADGWFEYDSLGHKKPVDMTQDKWDKLDDNLGCDSCVDIGGKMYFVERESDRLVKVRTRLGDVTEYHYDDHGQLTEVKDSRDRTYVRDNYIWREYGADGKVQVDVRTHQQMGLDWLGIPESMDMPRITIRPQKSPADGSF